MSNNYKNKLNLKFHYGGSETSDEDTASSGTVNSDIVSDSSNKEENNENNLNDNIFFKIFNNVDNKVTTGLNNFVPSSLWMKILLSVIISGILLFIYDKFSNLINNTTTLLYDNCRLTAKGPRCSFSGSKKIEGDEGVYLIKTSYDKNIPISSDISFYIYLNKYNKISLVTDYYVIREKNLMNDNKKINKLIMLLNRGAQIYITPDNENNKEVLIKINNNLNEIILDLDKLNFKTDDYKKMIIKYKELLFKMKATIGYPNKNIKNELKNSKKNNKFGGNRVYDEIINDSIFYDEIIKEDLGFGTSDNFEYKTSESESTFDKIKKKSQDAKSKLKKTIQNSLKTVNTITQTDDRFNKMAYNTKNKLFNTNFVSDIWKNVKYGGKNKMNGGNIYNFSIKFKDEINSAIEDLKLQKNTKSSFNSKRLEWIIDSDRDQFIIKSKYNPNITLLYPDTMFSIRRFYGDKKIFERKLDTKNMFKSFKSLSLFLNVLRKKVLNIRDNYNIYYKIYHENKTGKHYLQVNNSNNNYIELKDKCSKYTGNLLYTGNNYKLCNSFVLKLMCENDRRCKSIVRSHNPNYCATTDTENVGGDETNLKYCEANTLFKQELDKGYINKNNLTDIVKFDKLKNNGISNWQLIKIDNL